jgi:aminoglycoside 6-adenylyltransferase
MAVLRRGFRVLVDTLDLEAGLRESAARPSPRSPPDQAAFAQLTHDFRYHLLWAAKKLRRGELWVATQACNCHLGGLLVTLLGWHTVAAQPLADAWHGGPSWSAGPIPRCWVRSGMPTPATTPPRWRLRELLNPAP